MNIKHLIIFCLVLNSCATTAPGTLSEKVYYDKYDKNRELLNKYCEQTENKQKPVCAHWEHSKLYIEGHSHGPLWIGIAFMPWMLSFVFIFLALTGIST